MFNLGFRNNDTVEIVDSVMGSRKTTNILQWMDNNPDNRYIYVSPLLSEVTEGGRVHKQLKNITLETPVAGVHTKSESLYAMLENGDSIACTHSLYLLMTDKHFKEISSKGYIVIIDEELDVIGGFDRYSRSDLSWLMGKGDISIAETDGMVSWVGDRSNIVSGHKYLDFLSYCDSKSLYCTKRSETMAVTQLPIKLFECAKRVVILTYMFKGNILDCFLQLKGFKAKPFTEITTEQIDKKEIAKLLTVVPPTEKMSEYSLSSTWYAEANAKQLQDVSNYIRNVARSRGVPKEFVLWTAPKDRAVRGKSRSKNLIKPVGYTGYRDVNGVKQSCWIAATTRATNDYYDKTLMVHCFNRRPIVSVSSYLQDYGCPVDLKVFATSELLQWAWRGCIRDNKPMTIAIGSKRMYGFFMDWLEDKAR